MAPLSTYSPLIRTCGLALASGLAAYVAAAANGVQEASACAEVAYRRLVDEFVDEHGLLLDYVGEIPTAKDCEEGRPNLLGWWSPIENGPMFTGQFLRAAIARAERLRGAEREAAAAECRKMANGLIRAASVSDVKGMVVRGFATDGRSHYPLSSTCQTVPWFFGMHAWAKSPFPTDEERKAAVAKMVEVAEAIEANGWYVPSDGRFTGLKNGDFTCEEKLVFRSAAMYLGILIDLWDATGDETWYAKYVAARDGKIRGCALTRLEVLEQGWRFDAEAIPCEGNHMWIYVHAVGCLFDLARLDKDPAVRGRYRKGLAYCAGRARALLALAKTYDNRKETPFKYANWRTGYRWKEQHSVDEARGVASTWNWDVLGHRKDYERETMSTPLAAVAVCGYAGLYRDEAAEAMAQYDFTQINLCEFFFGLAGWYAYPD